MNTKIGITYNLKDDSFTDDTSLDEAGEEFDTEHTIDAICDALRKNSYDPVKLGGDIDIIRKIRQEKIDFVFNIAEGHKGRSREAQIPALLELMNIPYTGSDPLALGLTLDKVMMKKIASSAEITTPRYAVIRGLDDLEKTRLDLRYPLIAKPAWEGSSKGIYNFSKVFDEPDLRRCVRNLTKNYAQQPILIEEYVQGREMTAGVIGNDPPRLLGLMQIENRTAPADDFFYSLETKRDWKNLVNYVSPPLIDQRLYEKLRHSALRAFREFSCRDIARIDFKVARDDKIYLLEVNPLPGLSPEYADLVIMARKNGIDYEELIISILHSAEERQEKAHKKIQFGSGGQRSVRSMG